MKASKFTEAQKAFILKQGEEGTPVAEICRKAGISQATYFNWKKRYGGLLPDEMRRLKALEDENSRLKKIVAGVETTTRSDPTARSDTTCRLLYIIPMAQPARHRERARKFQLPAVQRWGAAHF